MSKSNVFGIVLAFSVSVYRTFGTTRISAGSVCLSGIWEIKLDTQTGEQVWTATFDESGGSIAGEIDMNDGEGVLPLEGTVEAIRLSGGLLFQTSMVICRLIFPAKLKGGTTINGEKVASFGMARVCGQARSSETLCPPDVKSVCFCFVPIKIDGHERAKALQ
ncbi:MAG: hypothetical protein Ct9H300mP25_07090 [Acidobacteriota bacterium]|nr:MAG: hypothetical protein Ct9H300mP25_07090 [Acidobacteriota bacterium]